ncbi:Tobamovirus multiplication protein 2A [Forsythia ovata]|uniref:Tobamovirus multiplication protein 2A n=1 Tax=Forsythia ovata TaxID=205694 RepID=A0ABD1WIA1_9LAMI
MECKGIWGCLLKLVNVLLALVGLAMVGYGLYLFIEYKIAASSGNHAFIVHSNGELLQLGRPMLMAASLDNISDKLPNAWFIYLFIGIGVVLVVISCFGCIGATLQNGCCLTCYSIFVILLILVELGCAAFIFFDKSWKEEIPTDKTGTFDMIYKVLEKHWKVIKWVALGAVILEALVFLLALVVRAVNRPANYDYDSDDESIGSRQQTQQPLLNKTAVPATGAPVTGTGTLDQRPSRNDAWSARMREKYGRDTSEFTYNPSESDGNQQAAAQPSEGRRCCIIM